MADIRSLATREVYRSRWMRVREDEVVFPDGSRGLYGVVDKSEFAVIVPLHDDGRVQLAEQYRYAAQGRFWEVPQGAWEQREDIDPYDLAAGELEEETGWKAGHLERIGRYLQAPGYSSQGYSLFLARDLQPGTVNRDPQEQDMKTSAFTLSDIMSMIDTGAIMDTTTIAALGLLRLKGRL